MHAVSSRIELQIACIRELTAMLGKRAKYEEEYAKRLAELAKASPKSPFSSIPEAHMKEAFECLLPATGDLAAPHANIAKAIGSDVTKSLEENAKAKDAIRKRIIADIQKKNKLVDNVVASAKKAQEAYKKAAQDAQTAKNALSSAEEQQKPAAKFEARGRRPRAR